MTADAPYLHLLAARQAEATLLRGFTTVRDLGGPVFGLKRWQCASALAAVVD
jgi:imidazolonepropionase-like amidohydrolase